ncbi:MAG: hypothetical protein A2381_06375 [Bdellovibrionales bacterium RIFOXYB1_FULL_37_110]|nr:MAG: hypothetical protein A2181_08395 [Bdellovibrionales bacterium RIFOXYA1_FULL_38_20]OFZ50167.1 MAG: hypothetical protein A2417_19225 [Bdellovibrionales bacterium RIFOXYC1_FULL_37_79]OFZ57604.1 MAG: hypothetical protein A2381_06375 [Bdellovibrionales bacterium RIFOXYB1_FULL_37_110]OFZ61371.1 MAG: hypothetical protein A2577_00740 [Bdellovibrionales bacterium RIFOXYD1_FULL_36_51]
MGERVYRIFFIFILFLLMMSNVPASTTTDATRAYSYDFRGEEVYSNGDVLNLVTMLGVGAVSKSLLTCKVKTTDTTVAAASGISYLGGEVYSFFAYKGVEAKYLEYGRDIDGKLIDSDKKALEALKSNYENIKDVATTKKYLQYAAAAGFTTSAVLAYWDAHEVSDLKEACKVALQTAATKCATGATINPATSAIDSACLSSLPTVIKKENELDLSVQTAESKPSTEAKTEIEQKSDEAASTLKSTCVDALCAQDAVMVCDKYKKELRRTLGECSEADLKDPIFQQDSIKPVGIGFWDWLLATAMAESKLTSVLGMGSVGVGVYLGMVDKQAGYLDRMISKPFNRGVVFSAFAGLSYLAAKSNDEVIKTLEQNINRIEKVLAPMKKPGTAAIYVPGEVPMSLHSDIININVDQPVDSVTIPTTQVLTEQKEQDPKNLDTLTNLGAGVNKSGAQLITEISDGISGKTNLSGATLNNAKTLASGHMAIGNKLRSLHNKLGAKTKKGELPNALNLEKKAAAALGESLNKSFRGTGFSPERAKEVFKEVLAMKDLNPKDFSVVATKLDAAKNESFDSYTNYLPVPEKKKKGQEEVVNSALQLEKFQNSTNEVSDADKTIWDIISFRYFRSAYPVFSDEMSEE